MPLYHKVIASASDLNNGVTGSGTIVLATSPALVTPDLGTPTALVGTNITGTAAGLTAGTSSAVAVGGITGLGTGVATSLAVAVGTDGAPVVKGGALGTPSSGVATNLTGTAAGLTAGGNLVSGGALGTPSSGVATNITGLNGSNISTGTVAPARGGMGPYLRAYLNTSQTGIVNNTNTLITFDTVTVDSGSTYYSTSTGKYTPLVAGTYRVVSVVQLSGTYTVTQSAGVFKNDGFISNIPTVIPTGGGGSVMCSDIVQMNGSTDYITIKAYLNVTGTGTAVGGTGNTYLTIEYLGV